MHTLTKQHEYGIESPTFFTTLFANEFLDNKLNSFFKEDFDSLDFSALWISEEFNQILNTYNKQFDLLFLSKEDINFFHQPKDIFEYSSYLATLQYSDSNLKKYNNKSLETFKIYVLDKYLKH